MFALREEENSPIVGLRFPKEITIGEVDLSIDSNRGIIWCYFNPKERPCFTLSQLSSLHYAFNKMKQDNSLNLQETPIQWFVSTSKIPGIYNYGGDLKLFIECVRARNREKLAQYAEQCIDLVYRTYKSFNLQMMTIALLQGDALGGGFEAALSCDFIIAEKHVRVGLPESKFGLFPGMGAYSFLSRRIGAQRAKTMIVTGKTFSASELLKWGGIDEVVDTGSGPEAVLELIRNSQNASTVAQTIKRVEKVAMPVSKQELMDVVSIWIDSTMSLSETNLEKMERLLSVQEYKWKKLKD